MSTELLHQSSNILYTYNMVLVIGTIPGPIRSKNALELLIAAMFLPHRRDGIPKFSILITDGVFIRKTLTPKVLKRMKNQVCISIICFSIMHNGTYRIPT